MIDVRRYLTYKPDTGIFTWKKRGDPVFDGRYAGRVAGSRVIMMNARVTYIQVFIKGKRYTCHRLAWLYMTGEMPHDEVDHINGDGTDNRWCNLRSVSRSENMRNRPRQLNNKSGVVGVSKHTSGKLAATINIGGKQKHLGLFEDKFDAICARKSAEVKQNYHRNHGRIT